MKGEKIACIIEGIDAVCCCCFWYTHTEQGHVLPHGDCTAPDVVKTVLVTECNWVGLHLFTLGE